jgi:hypothetical protein
LKPRLSGSNRHCLSGSQQALLGPARPRSEYLLSLARSERSRSVRMTWSMPFSFCLTKFAEILKSIFKNMKLSQPCRHESFQHGMCQFCSKSISASKACRQNLTWSPYQSCFPQLVAAKALFSGSVLDSPSSNQLPTLLFTGVLYVSIYTWTLPKSNKHSIFHQPDSPEFQPIPWVWLFIDTPFLQKHQNMVILDLNFSIGATFSTSQYFCGFQHFQAHLSPSHGPSQEIQIVFVMFAKLLGGLGSSLRRINCGFRDRFCWSHAWKLFNWHNFCGTTQVR